MYIILHDRDWMGWPRRLGFSAFDIPINMVSEFNILYTAKIEAEHYIIRVIG